MQELFEILFLIGNPGKFLKGNLICYISRTEGSTKLNFGEVSLQICQNFFRENRAKKF